MDNNLEKLMEKQMKWQKITAILLAILIAALIFAGLYIGKAVNEMTAAVEQAETFLTEATEKLENLDGVTAKMDAAAGAFDPIIESLNNFKNKFKF